MWSGTAGPGGTSIVALRGISMDRETFERLYDIVRKDFPDEDLADPFTKPLPDLVLPAEDDFNGQLGLIVNNYMQAIRLMDTNGAPTRDAGARGSVFENFMDDMYHLIVLFQDATVSQPRHIEKAIRRVQMRHENKMKKFVNWFGWWALFSDLPVQYSLIKREIVDNEKLLNERQLVRYLHVLCDIGMLKRIDHIKPTTQNCGGTKPNSYYYTDSDFFKYKTDMNKLSKNMPQILEILARMSFEKNLAIRWLVENNLYSGFDRENKEFIPVKNSC